MKEMTNRRSKDAMKLRKAIGKKEPGQWSIKWAYPILTSQVEPNGQTRRYYQPQQQVETTQ